MITREQLDNWVASEQIQVEQIDNGVEFASDNPWDIENAQHYGTIIVTNGILRVEFMSGGWNGYGTEEYTDMPTFIERWNNVMEYGLIG